jgi:predicted ester cyclase
VTTTAQTFFCAQSLIAEPPRETYMNKEDAQMLAAQWIDAWNAHDLEQIMTHYEDTVELTSPVAAKLLGISDGKIVGKINVSAYFRKGLEAYPQLHFHLEDVLWGLNSLVLCYRNQNGSRTAEFMEISMNGKALRVVANYNA